ncbi:MAG: NosD domain-containing protein [Rhodanobacteraceae bacterium]
MPPVIQRSTLALTFVLFSPFAAATTYYVATNGSNGNPGTLAQPWATIQHAADTIGPGDIVQVRAGNYEGAYFETSGTASAPIVVQAYPGESPAITSDNPETPDGFNLEGSSFMVIDGFTINGRSRAGIRAVTCEHVTVRNNSVDQSGVFGIFTGFCDDMLIENNVTSRSGDQHGIYVSNSGDRPVIRNNVIWGNYQAGIHMNGDGTEGGDGIISDALVEGNVIYDNGTGGGSGINMDGVQDSLIRNNLVYQSHASGLSLYQIDGGGPSTGNRVLNNTILVASNGRWALNVQDASTDNTFLNNIVYNNHSYRGVFDISSNSLPGLVSDYNVVMDRFTTDDGDTILTLAQWRQQTGQDAHSLTSTPSALFADPTNGDYHLSPTSPALNAGTTLGDVPVDLADNPRPQGPAFDIGAYEAGGGGGGGGGEMVFSSGFDQP